MAKPMANPQMSYLKTQIETASQPQLLVMLFDAAVKKLRIAKKAIEEKSIERAHTELIKVQKIFTELMVALDFDIGGELANQLFRIYDFVYHHLVKANIRQDTKMIDDVLPIVESLRDGWTQAVEKYTKDLDAGTLPKVGTSSGQPKSFDSARPGAAAIPMRPTAVPVNPAARPVQPMRPAAAPLNQNARPVAAPVPPSVAKPAATPVPPAAARPAAQTPQSTPASSAPAAPKPAVIPQPLRKTGTYAAPAAPAAPTDQPRRGLNVRG